MVSKRGPKVGIPSNESDSLRIDKWLWCARFFKTRKLAADAVSGGKVHINGQRCKPSKEIRPGVRLAISKDIYTWQITVVGINPYRRPAAEAVLLYQEDAESVDKRRELSELNKCQNALEPRSRMVKPNKKQRRQIHRFKQG